MGKLVNVREYFDRSAAELARSVLGGSGIPAVVAGDDMGGLRPDLGIIGRVRVAVDEVHYAEALEILSEFDSANIVGAEEEEGQEEPEKPLHDREIQRAYYAAVFGFFVLPIFTHAYAIKILLHKTSSWSELSSSDKRRFAIAGIFSVAAFAVLSVMVYID